MASWVGAAAATYRPAHSDFLFGPFSRTNCDLVAILLNLLLLLSGWTTSIMPNFQMTGGLDRGNGMTSCLADFRMDVIRTPTNIPDWLKHWSQKVGEVFADRPINQSTDRVSSAGTEQDSSGRRDNELVAVFSDLLFGLSVKPSLSGEVD